MEPELAVSETRVNQKMLDAIAYEVKVHKLMLLERKKEAELAKNWDKKRFDAENAGKITTQQQQDTFRDLTERVLALQAARRQGKPVVGRSMFNQDIDVDASSLLIDQYKTFVKVSSTAQDTDDDAYASSVADKIMKNHKGKKTM